MIPWTIDAKLVERYIFNFRIRPDELKKHLPVPWLQPQVFNGWGIISFCILDIDKITIAPIPPIFNYQTTSCAYRAGVFDHSNGAAVPSVYITDRNSNLTLIAKLGPWLLADALPMVTPSIKHLGDQVNIQVNYADGQKLFCASARLGEFKSSLFSSLDDFKSFILAGVSSYTPSVYLGKMTRVDLHKSDTVYAAMVGEVDYSWLDGSWNESPLELDSVIRATGGTYKWVYKGLMPFK